MTPINIAIGVTGGIYVPLRDYAWAWGPALQVQAPLNNAGSELTLTAGLAAGADTYRWSPGRESGLILRVGITRFLSQRWLGLTAGLSYQSIKATLPGKGDGAYSGLTPGIVLRQQWTTVTLRVEGLLFLGRGSYDPSESGFAVGGATSAFLNWNW